MPGLKNFCICRDKTIVVVTENQIIRFDQLGNVLHESCDAKLKSVYSASYFAECPVTGNIAASNYKSYQLTVIDNKFEFLFQRDRKVKTLRGKKREFSPFDICYDSEGNLLVMYAKVEINRCEKEICP